MPCWWTYPKLSASSFKKGGCEKAEIVVEKPLFARSVESAVGDTSARYGVERLRILQNGVGQKKL